MTTRLGKCGCEIDDNESCPLHAAAPDLLAALEALVAVEISERSGRPFDQAARIALNDARHMARAAIRKARGEEDAR